MIEGRCRVAGDKGRCTRCTGLQLLRRTRTWTCREGGRRGGGGAPEGPGGQGGSLFLLLVLLLLLLPPRTTRGVRTPDQDTQQDTHEGGGQDPDQDTHEGGGQDDDLDTQGCGADVGEGSGASGFGPQQRPYLRGPSSLPRFAVAEDRRPTIRPLGAK